MFMLSYLILSLMSYAMLYYMYFMLFTQNHMKMMHLLRKGKMKRKIEAKTKPVFPRATRITHWYVYVLAKLPARMIKFHVYPAH